MKRFDSQGLGDVARSLGLTGEGAPVTELHDGTVDQILSVNELVRRGRTLAQTQGIFTAVLSNTHAIGDSQTATISPYDPGALARPPFPGSVPRGLELWILGASCQQVTGSGTFTGALYLNVDNVFEGMGVNQAGTDPGIISAPIPLARWTSMVTNSNTIGIQGDGYPFARLGIRIPRSSSPGSTLIWASTSTAATRFDCFALLGLFPVGLGQDVLT